MFIGHLPAGYLLVRASAAMMQKPIIHYRRFMACGLVGSVFPDIDMFYFYGIDNRQTHHHRYFTHYPILWGILLATSLLLFASSQYRRYIAPCLLIFALMANVHLVLDTIVGDIWWLAPFVDRPFALFSVPTLYQPWWLNFIVHWSFGFELALLIYALYTWKKAPCRTQ